MKLRTFRRYFEPQPLAPSFVPRGRSQHVIYAVTVSPLPGVTKVGRTARWKSRRQSYASWNLSPGDAVTAERVFVLTDEYVDLPAVEKMVLAGLPFPLRHGSEWFTAEIEDVERHIDRILTAAGLSYLCDAWTKPD